MDIISPYISENEVKKIKMARQKDQKMRFNDIELALMKTTFADNEDLLFTVRKVMLQFPISESEQKALDTVMSEPLKALLTKIFKPELDPDAPLFQLVDMHLGLNKDMGSLGVEAMMPLFKAKELEIEFIKQQLDVLFGEKPNTDIKLSNLKEITADDLENYVNLTARNYLLSYIDTNIQQVKFLSGKKEESVEETIKRLQQDSSK